MHYPSSYLNIDESSITDVAAFCQETTQAYEDFEHDIQFFINNVQSYSPQEITDACLQLKEQRSKLAKMDEKMFDILDLAGNELSSTPLLQDYRISFTKAQFACNNLFQKLQAVKLSILETRTTSHMS